MKAATVKEINSALDAVFEVRSIIQVLGARMLDIAEMEESGFDQKEVFRFTRVTDACARMLEDVAGILDRVNVMEAA